MIQLRLMFQVCGVAWVLPPNEDSKFIVATSCGTWHRDKALTPPSIMEDWIKLDLGARDLKIRDALPDTPPFPKEEADLWGDLSRSSGLMEIMEFEQRHFVVVYVS